MQRTTSTTSAESGRSLYGGISIHSDTTTTGSTSTGFPVNYGYNYTTGSSVPMPQQPGVIPFNLPVHIDNVTASTTLLRPRKPGDLLPIDYEPTNLDVCSGRGKRNWTHSGNIAFRDLIQHSTPTYMTAATKNEKTAIVCNIVEEMRALGCQFLKQDSKTNRWYDIGDAQARDKVGHSLRDQVTAYNRSQITGAPSIMEPLTLENMLGYNNLRTSITASGVSKQQHIRRPSLALSDSGNEAEERRMSLDTTSILGEFARRPSWVAGSDTTIRTDDAVMDGYGNDFPTVTAEDNDVLNEIPVMPAPANDPLSTQSRRKSTWDYFDTLDYYIDHDMDSIGNKDAKYYAMRSMSSTTETPVVPIVSEDLMNTKNRLLGAEVTTDMGTNSNNPLTPRNNEKGVDKSITMTDVGAWNPLLSKGQIEKLLQESVQTWDPRFSSNMSGVTTVRRSAMAGGTTIRRYSSSLKLSDRMIESLLNVSDFGESYGSFDLEPPTVNPGNNQEG
jgi:hypothetical protein